MRDRRVGRPAAACSRIVSEPTPALHARLLARPAVKHRAGWLPRTRGGVGGRDRGWRRGKGAQACPSRTATSVWAGLGDSLSLGGALFYCTDCCSLTLGVRL